MDYWGVDGTNEARAGSAAPPLPPMAERATAKTTKGGGRGGVLYRCRERLEIWATWEERRNGFTGQSCSGEVGYGNVQPTPFVNLLVRDTPIFRTLPLLNNSAL